MDPQLKTTNENQRKWVSTPPALNAISLTEEQIQRRCQLMDQGQRDDPRYIPAGLPPATMLANHLSDVTANSSAVAVVKDSNLKMYHVMSVKQSLREDLAEHSYQFSCRTADWSSMSFSQVPMQFEPLELHVVEALGEQDVGEYFQQPAKAITEEVSVMRGPQAEEWIQAVCVYEEMPKENATSTPLPARLILVAKPNVHGGPARKTAKIVTYGNFQDVHPDEFTASKTPGYPSLSCISHAMAD